MIKKFLLILLFAIIPAVFLYSEFVSASANPTSIPVPLTDQAQLTILRVDDDVNNFRDIKPVILDTQVILQYPDIQSEMSIADTLYDNAITMSGPNYAMPSSIPPIPESHTIKISSSS